jgi:hypothetical protein
MSEQVYILYFNMDWPDIDIYRNGTYLNDLLSQGWKVKSSTPLNDVKTPNSETFSRILFVLEQNG